LSQYYPPAVHRKAERLEQLLLRLEAGEALDKVCVELELKLSAARVEKLKAKYEAGGRRREVLLDGRFGHYQQVNSAVRAYLYERKQADESLTAGQLVTEVVQKYEISVSEGHINHVLREMALTRSPGRPRNRPDREPAQKENPPQENAGLFFPGRSQAAAGCHDDD
jgi:transposase